MSCYHNILVHNLCMCFSYHFDFNFMGVVNSVLTVFKYVTNMTPKYAVHGGTMRENLALQNIQVKKREIII